MKIAIIGGGGVRSMFLAKSIALRSADLGITSLAFMDNNSEKLRIFGGMASCLAKLLAPDLEVITSTDPAAVLNGADYVITTIRPGGDALRVRDERTALAEGVLGQETTGAAGFSFAMRSIPALVFYCGLIKKYARSGVKVFNFTNPAGLVSQALCDLGYNFCYGICDAPSGMLHQFAAFYGAQAGEISGELYGLNHLSFFKSIKLRGKEIMDSLIASPEAYAKTDLRFFEQDLLRHIRCVPNEYLYYYFYPEKALANIKKAGKTRGEIIEEVNRGMMKELDGLDIENDFDKCLEIYEKWYSRREDSYMAGETGIHRDKPWSFDIHAPDSGGYAGVALEFIDIVRNSRAGEKKKTMILCVPNRKSIAGLEDGDVVEVSCDINAEGPLPHRFEEIDEQRLEQIRRVKIYERLAARAILEKDQSLAADALMLHPLVNSYSIAKVLAAKYTEYNAPFFDGTYTP
ncbi:MAG: hypothetical protein LBQ61_06910 [Spirochaetales bacterium]|nr:hypothetical protein [Spirochaetales bacterium]